MKNSFDKALTSLYLGIVVLGGSVLSGSVLGASAQAAGKIAFISERDGNKEIYAMNPDGTGQTNLTNTPSRSEIDPDFSPDGSKIVYGDGQDLWLMNSDGSSQAAVTTDGHRKLEPDYSPDGSKFLFSASTGSDWDIFTIPPANGSSTKLISNPSGDYQGSWSPDGTKIVFKTFPDDYSKEEIFLCNADGSGQVRLTSTAGNNRPEFSPDGNKIVFESKRDSGNPQIYVMNIDGSAQTRLTQNGFNDTYPTWSPDGSQIAFVSNRDGNNEIYRMNADGSQQVRLTNNQSNDYHPTWTGKAPHLSLTSARAEEGDSGVTNLDFTATLSFASADPVNFQFSTVGGSAEAGTDYTAVNKTIVIQPGETSATVTVPVTGDPEVEPDETVGVRITNVVGAVPTFEHPERVLLRNPDNGHIYEIITKTLNYAKAKAAAESLSYGGTSGHLVTITSQAEQDFLTPHLALGYYRLGAIQPAGSPEPGGFSWITGEPFTYSNWRSGEPNNAGKVENSIIAVSDGVWNDIVDTDPAESFIVEYDVDAPEFPTAIEATGVIVNDDAVDELSVNDASATEGNGEDASLNFTVSLSAPSDQTFTVHYATVDGTAKAGTAYTAVSGDLTFAPGETQKTVAVSILGDVLDEADETLELQLSGASGGTISRSSGIGTIIDDDQSPTLSIQPTATFYEGLAPADQPALKVTLSKVSAQTVTVKYATADNRAKAPGDYTKATGTLVFAPGETEKTIAVAISDDALNEADEDFKVSLSVPFHATIKDATLVATILDNDGQPSFSINDASLKEGKAASSNMKFTIRLSKASARTTSIKYVTADGTALAGSDYSSSPLKLLTFEPGETAKAVEIKIRGDVSDEDDEFFTVNLSGATNATIGRAQGIGTIKNDDIVPAILVTNSSVVEGDTGTKNLIFTLKLSVVSGHTVTVLVNTRDDLTQSHPAVAGVDYIAIAPTTVTFQPGETSKTVAVPVIGDVLDEYNEVFQIILNDATNARIRDGLANGTIGDNDPTPTASINDVTVVEGNDDATFATFTVQLTGGLSDNPIEVIYTAKDGTATAPEDYTTVRSGIVIFQPGERTKTIKVAIKSDTAPESKEQFYLVLTQAINANLGKKTGVATILDDDAPPAAVSTKSS